MQTFNLNKSGRPERYSAKNSTALINFLCVAPEARHVSLIGDFNNWEPNAHPMTRMPDGGWHIQLPLNSGHHQYLFLVDGHPTLDKRAQGTVRNAQKERVSLIAVS